MTRQRQAGFALTDLLTVCALGVACLSLAWPALYQAQSAAQQAGCTDHLRQIGRAIHQYADAHRGTLPVTAEKVGWITRILPYLGEQAAYDAYQWDADWNHADNAAAMKLRVSSVICPAGPHPDRWVVVEPGTELKAGPTDYVAMTITGAVSDLFPPKFDRSGAMFPPGRLIDVVDGLSQTGMIYESADKPNRWQVGKLVTRDADVGMQGAWLGFALNGYRGYDWKGVAAPGPCAVNCNNQTGIYGFHPGGANILMCDASVKFLHEGMNVWLAYALITRNGGEVLDSTDF